MQHERITAEDVRVGDRIARTRTATFREVESIREGDTTRRFLYVPTPREIAWHEEHGYPMGGGSGHVGGTDRPRRTAKWWRELDEQGEGGRS